MAENNDLPNDDNLPEDDPQGSDSGANGSAPASADNGDSDEGIPDSIAFDSDAEAPNAGDYENGDHSGLDVGTVRIITIEDEMRASYLEYAMSVIVRRALPDARDGLKPVHRRILYAMNDMGLTPGTSHKKSARVVGEVLGKYHPHGDSSVYDAMARMAQPFSLRYPLVDGQGNFGSVDGDSPAAMRYTEAKLSRAAMPILQDIDMDTVDWGLNFDDSLEEPLVLPGALPNLLINGTTGIAVGMATNIPPHNLTEISNAIVHVIDNWERRDEIRLEELMTFVKGPDFPTGALILGTDGIASAFATGRGRVLVRARTEIEEAKNNRFRIIVTEIPYQVNKSSLIERMAELVREGKLDQISDLRDESDRKGMRIVIELKRGAAPKKVANRLFKYTQLQTSFGVNTLALVDGQPVTLSLRRALTVYVEHREEVLTRRTRFELRKARERAHILEGLRIALENLDEVIKTIRASQSVDDARTQLMSKFGLSEVQAQAILDMQLRRLAALERQKIEDEYQQIMAKINYLEDLLAHPEKIRALVREGILEIKEKFGDARRSQIIAGSGGEFNEEDLISQENVLISYSAGSYIKRVDASAFKAQGRGGRGVKGMATKAEDEVIDLLFARTLDHILFFTDKGRVYSSRVYELPEGSRTARGSHVANVLSLMPNENVLTMLVVQNFDDANYITLATQKGRIKRMELSAFRNVRVSGLIAMNLDPDDSLDWARLTNGEEDFMVVTRGGKSLRFRESAVRAMGRTAAGVMAIRLLNDDLIVSLDVVKPESDLLVLHELGYGKRVSLDEYSPKGRYTQGIWTTDHRRLEELGPIVSARVVHADDQFTVMTSHGIVLRTPVAGVSRMGRSTRGVRVVNLQKGDTVAAVAVLRQSDLVRKVEGEEDALAAEDGAVIDGVVSEGAVNEGAVESLVDDVATTDETPDDETHDDAHDDTVEDAPEAEVSD